MTEKKRSPRTENPVHIRDPKAIRALAHAARVEAINELYSTQKSHTATELAALTGLTPSAMSYHLRALKKWGIVADAPSDGDGRERRWKAAGTDLNLDTASTGATPGLVLADMELETLRRRMANHAMLRDAARRRGEQDDAPVMIFSGSVLKLTLEQRAEFKNRMSELMDEFELAQEDAPSEAERMYVLWSMLPEVREAAAPPPRKKAAPRSRSSSSAAPRGRAAGA